MATWIAHLRIAENVLDQQLGLSRTSFTAGNIAPDAGVPNENWSSFDPPGNITHWKGVDGKVNADLFVQNHVRIARSYSDSEYASFVLGYYSHLLADIEWDKLYTKKKEEPLYKEGLEKDKGFIWRIKEDWYGQDFVYLKNNRKSLFFTCFQHLNEVDDYLDYFPTGAFTGRFEYIRNMYLKNYETPPTEFLYLSSEEMDTYVQKATEHIKPQITALALELGITMNQTRKTDEESIE